jgi:hypothetical protein
VRAALRLVTFLLVAAGALIAACGTRPPICGPSSCAVGCCDQAGVCQSGMTNSACGERGGLCQACPISGICQAGRCGFVGGTGGGAAAGGSAAGGSAAAGSAAGGLAAGGSAAGGSAAGGSADGGVVPGGTCSAIGFFCYAPTAAIECKVSRWVLLPCRGDGGCSDAQGTVRCDMHGNLPGDACASSEEAKGLCSADGRGTLECRSGVLVLTNVCRTCTEINDTIICQP